MRNRHLLTALCFSLLSSLSAGELVIDTIESKAIRQTVKLNVLLPDGYKDDTKKRYPVVYLLHGLGGDYTEWRRVGIESEARGLPLIVVMPEGNKSFYVNRHDDAKLRWGDHIIEEVIPHVDKKYRTHAVREQRGVNGLSMGGYGAIMLGLKHPELFASAASHSGALGAAKPSDGRFDKIRNAVFGPDGSDQRKSHDVFEIARKLEKKKFPHLYFDCGSKDFLLPPNRDFAKLLAKLGVDYEYREVPGKHDFAYWKRNVRYSLTEQLKAFERAKAAAKSVAKNSGGSIAGDWAVEVVWNEDTTSDYTLKLREKGSSWSGTLISPRSGEHKIKKVTVKDGTVRLELDREFQGNPITLVYEGKLEKGVLSGKAVVAGFEDQAEIEWSGKRVAAQR